MQAARWATIIGLCFSSTAAAASLKVVNSVYAIGLSNMRGSDYRSDLFDSPPDQFQFADALSIEPTWVKLNYTLTKATDRFDWIDLFDSGATAAEEQATWAGSICIIEMEREAVFKFEALLDADFPQEENASAELTLVINDMIRLDENGVPIEVYRRSLDHDGKIDAVEAADEFTLAPGRYGISIGKRMDLGADDKYFGDEFWMHGEATVGLTLIPEPAGYLHFLPLFVIASLIRRR